MQAPQPPPMQQHPPNGPPPQQQQQVMPNPGNGAPMMQHAQYAPQHQAQGVNYNQGGMPPSPVPPPAQQQPQQGQSFPHQGLNGGWQSDQDYNERRKMIAKM